ncbi:GntR family transcriptional regulator [Ammoniphilus sp. 3BR4]|uniref:GntR family transcriptional regulator n=1 Tax=Ammoniphilus sp. 3BR4 TaxID=3158265 RepID=UPI0034668A87
MSDASETDIYKEIKKAIIQQRLRPNMQLVEEVLAESFGVSRTPIRNVLRRLAHEKMVKIIPHKGTFVSCPTVEEAKEVFEMRRVLEGAAIRKACKQITGEHLHQLELLINEEHAARDHGDLFQVLQITCDFHLEIAKIAGNSYYNRYIEELISLNYVIMAFYGRRQLTLCGLQEHAQILNALNQRDENQAEKLMLEHLQHIEAYLDFDEMPSTPSALNEIFKPSTHSLY